MNIKEINFEKAQNQKGLIPVIVQHANSHIVLMLGFMNKKALTQTINTKKVTFFSRTKNRLWVKGETSNHFLNVVDIIDDCDHDTLLIKALPDGPTCHTGQYTCFNEKENNINDLSFIQQLEQIIEQRKNSNDTKSYVKSLFEKGINKISQKVGEEAVELVIEALNNEDDKFLNESADLLFHYLLLLNKKGFQMKDVVDVLLQRHK